MDKLSHAYLFCGQEKLGKKTFALEFVKLFNGSCLSKSCNPDLVFIEPKNSVIQIAQIRELSRKLSLKPHFTTFKTAIIDQAHRLNKEAQNCLLKTLEEPKGRALLILITEMPELLFSTILSRVQKIKFFSVKKDKIKNYLKKQEIQDREAEEIARFSFGKPGLAIDFVSNPEILQNQKKIIKELISISSASLSSRFQYAKDLSTRALAKAKRTSFSSLSSPTRVPAKGEEEALASSPLRNKGSIGEDEDSSFSTAKGNIREILDIWLRYFRKALILTTLMINSNSNEKIFRDIRKFKKIIKQIENTNFLISTTNVNPRLALEILMLEL